MSSILQVFRNEFRNALKRGVLREAECAHCLGPMAEHTVTPRQVSCP